MARRVNPDLTENLPVAGIVDSVGLPGVYPFEHFTHLLVHQIDCLKGSDHHSKFGDFPSVIARDHVDPIDVLAFNCCLKLEDGMVTVENLFGVAETFRGIA